MDWLNFNHLHYFWMVARTGSVSRAAEQLMLSPSTVSAQIHALEQSLGSRLLQRKGRRLVLTEVGQLSYSYADGMFSLGREFVNVVKQRPGHQPGRLMVGLDDAVPKLVAREILRPAFQLGRPIHITCREGSSEELLGDLTGHRLDLIIADEPAPSTVNVRVFSHPLGECGVTFLAAPRLAARLRRGFPQSLHASPALLPTARTAMRRNLDRWFHVRGIEPQLVGEFDDTALTKVFGADGLGFFAVPTVIAAETRQHYRVREIGSDATCVERFYAISAERQLKHPAVVAITQAARLQLFGGDQPASPAHTRRARPSP